MAYRGTVICKHRTAERTHTHAQAHSNTVCVVYTCGWYVVYTHCMCHSVLNKPFVNLHKSIISRAFLLLYECVCVRACVYTIHICIGTITTNTTWNFLWHSFCHSNHRLPIYPFPSSIRLST